MNIEFFSEDIEFSLQNKEVISDWIYQVIQEHNYELLNLNYIFCSDSYLLEINQEHLQHDYYTDIITFDNSEEDHVIESDIFISIDRVTENAKEGSNSFDQELHRVMIHGVLHLLGFSDKTESEKTAMREKEDACLFLLTI